jgi:predicted AAA+ superfamily ATPase
MPLSFRNYIQALSEKSDMDLPRQIPEIDLFNIERMREAAQELEIHSQPIEALFRRYLKTGGYPYAISAEIEEDKIPKRIYRQFQHAIREEMRRAGRRENYFRELVSWAVDKYLGREFAWSKASSDTHIGSKNTARDYLEDGEAVFIWHIMKRVVQLGEPTPANKSPKKLYTVDPFCWHSLTAWVQGLDNPWGHTLDVLSDEDFLGTFVESVVADHFKRHFDHFALYHRASQGKEEIDFVLHDTPDKKSLVEVKYRNSLHSSDRKYLAKYGGGFLATKDQFGYHEKENVLDIPVYNLLAGLPYDLTLFPSRE